MQYWKSFLKLDWSSCACLHVSSVLIYIYNGDNLSRLKILLRVPYSSRVILVLVVWIISYTWNISAPNFNMICVTIPVADYIGAFQDALLLWILLAIFGLSYKLPAWHLWPTNTFCNGSYHPGRLHVLALASRISYRTSCVVRQVALAIAPCNVLCSCNGQNCCNASCTGHCNL